MVAAIVGDSDILVLQEAGPLPGPESGLLFNTQNELSTETWADKARDFIGKGSQAESSKVKEHRRLALSHVLQFRQRD